MPMTWDEFQKTLGWNNTDAVRGMQALANKAGYSGPVQERTGRQVSMGEGESGPMMTDEWGPAAGLSQAMGGYQFGQGSESDGDPTAQVYRGDGSLLDSARVGSSGGSMMKAAGIAIPALVAGGFGAGALGAMGYGPMAGTSAAGSSGASGSFNAALNNSLSGMSLANTGAAAEGGIGAATAVDALPAITQGGFNSAAFGATGDLMGQAMIPDALASFGGGLTQGAVNSAALGPTGSLPGLSGGFLGNALAAAGSAGKWMRDNPMAGKLLMGGGLGLLSASGGGASAAPKTYGPAQQWSSPIQRGLLTNPQQMNPAAIQRPAGLLAQGQQNDGAWRFLGGK